MCCGLLIEDVVLVGMLKVCWKSEVLVVSVLLDRMI